MSQNAERRSSSAIVVVVVVVVVVVAAVVVVVAAVVVVVVPTIFFPTTAQKLVYELLQVCWYSDLLRDKRSRDQIPMGIGVFCAHPVQPWGPPSLLYNGYQVFPGGNAVAWC